VIVVVAIALATLVVIANGMLVGIADMTDGHEWLT
jgi:hypothetical protein